jgi:hypothetical protein
MTRLLWKEISFSLWILLLSIAATTIIVATGDPLFFRDDAGSTSSWIALVFFILGLRAYSSELAADTPAFLYSRPIRWWQIWLAKILTAILGIVLTIILACAVRTVVLPHPYRPFLLLELSHGCLNALLMLSLAYAAGLMVSVLFPGISRAFAGLLGIIVVMTLPFFILNDIPAVAGNAAFMASIQAAGINVAVLAMAVGFVASILVSRKLPALTTRERWVVWLKPTVAAALLGVVLGFLHISFDSSCLQPTIRDLGYSPDGRWSAYSVTPIAKDTGSVVFLKTDSDENVQVPAHKGVTGGAWSNDSSKLAFLTYAWELTVVRPGCSHEKPRVVPLPILGTYDRYMLKIDSRYNEEYLHTLSWDTDGHRLAIPLWYCRIAVVDFPEGKLRMVVHKPSRTENLGNPGYVADSDPVWSEDAVVWPVARRSVHESHPSGQIQPHRKGAESR